MQKIKGISKKIVDKLVVRSNQLGQGRPVGVIGFIDQQGYVSKYGRVIDGGLSGLPFRKLLSGVIDKISGSLLELINQLPENAVVISTSPGKTGIITNTGGINIFDQPIIKIGIKNKKAVGVGVMYPESKFFQLATISEKVQLKSLAALTMEEERQAMRESTNLQLKFLEISEELPLVDIEAEGDYSPGKIGKRWSLPRRKVKGIAKGFARKLVDKSIEIEQGREVAAIGIINQEGLVEQVGEVIVGGMGYVPSRLLVSSYKDISTISLREAYTSLIPADAVIVHTHPGGTGVMHMGDAMAGPGTWGRPIVAIGHDEKGQIKGANVIEFSDKISQLADEYEDIEQRFFQVNTPEEEANLRKRRYEIAQEFTDLCREIVIK
ncbi:MAG: hypothetical protein PWR10_307 [Halanaerobiales bacterium]|nr:hypothetical protein [Halanaerobiales bacterium]